MLAGRISAPGRIELIEIPEPRLGAAPVSGNRSSDGGSGRGGSGEILFQPECACLCGSDLPYFDGSAGTMPQQAGHSLHEMIGSVVKSSGSRYRPGDRVLAVPVDQVGLFERFVVDAERAIPLDPRVPDEHALLAQPLGTVIFALKKLPNLLDMDVAVVGQGPIGQLFCLALRNLGAREIIAIDRLESRLAVSPQLGATATICNAMEDPIEAVRRITHGRMADIVVEAVGHRDQALNLCIDLCQYAGRILYFGVPPQQIDEIRWRDLFLKNITVYTSVGPDFRRDFPLAMRWIGEARVDVSQLITHRFPLAEIQTAFETFRDRKDGALKVLIEFPNWVRRSAGT